MANRLVLDQASFRELVRGRVVELAGMEIALEDMGFDMMLDAIADGMRHVIQDVIAQNKNPTGDVDEAGCSTDSQVGAAVTASPVDAGPGKHRHAGR